MQLINRKTRFFIFLLVCFLLTGFCVYTKYFTAPEIDFEKVIVKKEGVGIEISIAKLLGKPTLVAFFQTWCIDCIKEMPTIIKLKSRIQNPDFKVIMITDESAEKIETFRKKFPEFSFDYYIANNKLPSYGIKNYPTTYLLSAEGKVIKGTLEGYDWSSTEIVALVDKELKQDKK